MTKPYNPKKSALFHGENMSWLPLIPDESVDLIYIDPPFFLGRALRGYGIGNPQAFSDSWGDISAYISAMRERLLEARRVLRRTGSIFLHCDWRATHYLRLLLDKVFGAKAHRNEIIWRHKKMTAGECGFFKRASDSIHFYGKTDASKRKFNAPQEHTSNRDQARRLNKYDPIKKERYYMSDKSPLSSSARERRNVGGARVYENSRGRGFLALTNVWSMPDLSSKCKERTGYPAQKPLALLKRIISCASEPGDLVLDFYGGSGATAHAAHALKRRFITGDKNAEAIRVMKRRLSLLGLKEGEGFEFYSL